MPDTLKWINRLRLHGHPDGLLFLVLLGVVTGALTSVLMVFFITVLDAVLGLLNGETLEDFESLPPSLRFALPILGSLLLIALFRLTPTRVHTVGIAHVLDRLQRGRGHLPKGNLTFQFVAALVALASGHSVGREGPAVHLGAGMASQLGRATRRVPSQLRLLAGCGAAAAISAAFDTPLAGVLFAMEVILMEYSLLGFTPIIAASVTAAVCMRLFLGEHPVFLADHLVIGGGMELPLLIVSGLAIGLIAVVFHRLTRWFRQLWPGRRNARLLLAGALTGSLALAVPEVLGTGFDTVNATLTHQVAPSVLVMLLFAKILATAAAVGLGIPAGVIGPTLVIGACAGAVLAFLSPGSADPAFYALLGMAAMMSAVLHAPLAALLAVLELSLNAHAVFPAMVVVLGANLVCQHGFRLPSLFGSMLAAQGLRIETHPVRTALAQRYLSELATRQFVSVPVPIDPGELSRLTKEPTRWFALMLDNEHYLIDKDALTQAVQDWLKSPDDGRPDLRQMLRQLMPGFSRLERIDTDITLLEAVKWLHRHDTAGFLLPLHDGSPGLVTRAQLVSVLTSEGDIQ
ncbi:MAG: chloride channel protein [Saccharospirillum sp.]